MSDYFDAADVAIALEEKEMDLYHTMRKAAQADKQHIITLEQQLATFHSAVEHVTEDGCTRRSFVAMPEGWAMVHKDRLHDLELAEEQLSAAQSEIESAFREGFRSPATYNDVLVNCEDDEWENYKRGMK